MKYNDNNIINDRNSQIANLKYHETSESSAQDLLELYDKMVAERQYIADHNADHTLDNVIRTTDRHISMLKNILPMNNIRSALTSPIARPHLRPYINNGNTPPNNVQPNTNNNRTDFDNVTIPPLAPDNSPNNTIPNGNGNNNQAPDLDSYNSPDNNGNNPNNNGSNNMVATPPTQSRNRTARNSPLQSGFLSTLAKSIFGRKIRTQNIVEDKYRNRFHNMFTEAANIQNHCDPCRKMVTNECNILRLILLYITLHPHCHRTHILSTIAEERVRILTEIM